MACAGRLLGVGRRSFICVSGLLCFHSGILWSWVGVECTLSVARSLDGS